MEYNRDYVAARRGVGELGHPAGPTINSHLVSHIIESLSFKGNDIYGRAKILNTPNGKIVQNFIDEDIRLGMSSRALGSLKSLNNGLSEVQKDFSLKAIDIVHDPSGPDCFVNGLLEGKEWIVTEDGRIEEIFVAQIKKAVRLTETQKLDLFKKFITEISR